MKRTYYLTTGMVPGALGMYMWDQKQSEVADIVVSNTLAHKFDIAEMNLRLKGFSMMDKDGNEHQVKEFSQQIPIRIRGLADAAFLVTNSTLSLQPGEYHKIRLYIEPSVGKFIHTDKSESMVSEWDYIEFDIDNSLVVGNKPLQELVLRFDFPPFKKFDFSSWRNRFMQGTMNWRNKLPRGLSQSKM